MSLASEANYDKMMSQLDRMEMESMKQVEQEAKRLRGEAAAERSDSEATAWLDGNKNEVASPGHIYVHLVRDSQRVTS